MGLQKAWEGSPNASSRAADWTHPRTPRWRRKSLHRLRWPRHSGTLSGCAVSQFAAMHYEEPLPTRSAKGKKSIPPRDAGPGLAVRRPGERGLVTVLPEGYVQGSQDIPVRSCWAAGSGPQIGRLQWGRTAGESPSRLDMAKLSPKGVVGALEAPRTPTPLQNASLARRTRPVPAPRTRAAVSYLRGPPPGKRRHSRGRSVRSGGGTKGVAT